MKKSTAFLPTSLALAMAMVLPSMAFAQVFKEEIELVRDNTPTFINLDYNGITAEHKGFDAEYPDDKAEHEYTHEFDAKSNEITDASDEGWTRSNKSTARSNYLAEAGADNTGAYINHSIRDVGELSFYSTDDKEGSLIGYQGTYGKTALTLSDHNNRVNTNITAEHGFQNFVYEKAGDDVVRKEVLIDRNGIAFRSAKAYLDDQGAEVYADMVEGVTITPTGIKNLAAATEDGDAVSLGQTKQVIDEKVQASEQRITRSLNASIAGMIGTPPPTIIQTGSDNSAAIKKLNDNLAATDKRLDESNQRLNSAIDINDGVLTIKNDMNANNKKITKVANATDDGDAVNLGQLKAYVVGNSQAGAGMNQIKGDVVRLDKNLKQGMAAQSALNGLFQPYGVGKFSATAAIGGYGTETAVAVGTGYRFNENLAGKGGIAFPVGNASQATYNLGVNYEW